MLASMRMHADDGSIQDAGDQKAPAFTLKVWPEVSGLRSPSLTQGEAPSELMSVGAGVCCSVNHSPSDQGSKRARCAALPRVNGGSDAQCTAQHHVGT